MKKQTMMMLAVGAAALFMVYKHNGGAPLLGKQPKKTAPPGKASVLSSTAAKALANKSAHRSL